MKVLYPVRQAMSWQLVKSPTRSVEFSDTLCLLVVVIFKVKSCWCPNRGLNTSWKQQMIAAVGVRLSFLQKSLKDFHVVASRLAQIRSTP